MPFHPIALHFHIAIFIVNLIALIVLAFLRIKIIPNLVEGEKPTRGQSFFNVLDGVIVITLIAGIIATLAGIGTGFVELSHPPEIGSIFVYDMFMQLKVYTSFLLLAFYTIPLIYRGVYGKKMWKSRGMSITFIIYLLGGFFFLIISTILGSYYTTYLTFPYGGPVEYLESLEDFLNVIWPLFILFGASLGSNIHTYQPGYEISFDLWSALITVFLIVDLFIIYHVIFYGIRTRQINNFNTRFIKFKRMLRSGTIKKDNIGYQKLIRDMMALKIKRID